MEWKLKERIRLFFSWMIVSALHSAMLSAQPLMPETGVSFKTSDINLQKVFDKAERIAKSNEKTFSNYQVMVEGGGYSAVYLETQPMGGAMYAKRDVSIAKNNQLVFMVCQREDGRLPGSVRVKDGGLVSRYHELQGNYLPIEAFEVYFWLGQEEKYLRKLYETLEKYDNYLWRTRDSDHDGCLETWCIHDTGEDHSSRFGDSYHSWPFDFAPTLENLNNLSEKDSLQLCSDIYNHCKGCLKFDSPLPMESMDVMSYSYGNRYVLLRISRILQNGEADFWKKKAVDVQEKMKDYLWIPEKHACYDRDRDNKVIDILIHNNLRCMYFGSFSQQMADEFIKHHLMNPDEFWTRMPLPSVAVNDPAFRNMAGNNWSGKPEGLTFQRSIRALENYGHYAELTLIGKKLLKVIADSLFFVQQFDPFTGQCDEPLVRSGYGPTVLASLEFISRFYGIHFSQNKVNWSCLDNLNDYEYSQKWGDRLFKMETRDNRVFCSVNGKNVFSFSKGVRVISDVNGDLLQVVGIEPGNKNGIVQVDGVSFSFSVEPNGVYDFQKGLKKISEIPFFAPGYN